MLGASEAPGGYPLTPLGMPRTARVDFWSILDHFGVPFWSPLGTLWDPVGTLQASKQAKGDKEMGLSCQPWREVAISSRSGRHRVVPELDFRLKIQKIALFPKQCLHWRGSYGVAKEGAMVCFSARSRHASTHFCCYFTYFVHVTFTTLQRIGRFFQICCKLQYKINLFGLRWSLVPQWRVSGMLRVIFWPNWGDILSKYEQKLYFFKMSMS